VPTSSRGASDDVRCQIHDNSLTRILPVAGLVDALAEENAAQARALVRLLVDCVTLHPEGKGDRVEVGGKRAAILGLGCHFEPSERIHRCSRRANQVACETRNRRELTDGKTLRRGRQDPIHSCFVTD
jgi:hypothetical protein